MAELTPEERDRRKAELLAELWDLHHEWGTDYKNAERDAKPHNSTFVAGLFDTG